MKENKSDHKLSVEEYRRKMTAIKRIAIIATVFLVLTLVGYALIKSLIGGENGFANLISHAEKRPFLTSLIMVAINFTQVVIAFIPGEIVEQACGVLGPIRGTLICLIGIVLGSCFVIFLVRKFGRNLLFAICPKEKIDSISFLHNAKRRNLLTLILFFIPGTPKDLLTYAIGITDMSIPLYLILTTFARLPSIIMSTVSGDWIADAASGNGGIKKIIILNVISLVLCGLGYLTYIVIKKVIDNKNKNHIQPNSSSNE